MTYPPTPSFLWTAEPLNPDVAKSVERLRQAEDVRHVVILPDVHLAKEACVGVVIATKQLIYPAAIGSDIGCGMASVAVEAGDDLLGNESSAARMLVALSMRIPSNKHRSRQELPTSLSFRPLSDSHLSRLSQRDGRVQLGTLGRGNHFLEFQADEDHRLWIMVHSGSRAMGQAITEHHLRHASRNSGWACFDAETEIGRAYLADVSWARVYARENRRTMLRAVETILQNHFSVTVDWTSWIQSDHDHVRRETHFGEEFWVHRKGAQPAAPGEPGIIPGSMGTSSFHILGRGCPESLMSCSHGAGRRLSRYAARRSVGVREFERQLRGVWYDSCQTRQLLDEAPDAYKNIESVLRAQKDLVKIARKLKPLLSYKGI